MSLLTLKTERLTLRQYQESDLTEYFKLFSDMRNMYYLNDITVNNLDEARNSLKNAIEVNKKGTARRFCITLKDDNTLIGGVGYEIAADTPLGKIADPMGWFIIPEYQNKGYITEAAKTVLEFAFLHDNCVRVVTGCYKDNIPTQKVMGKVGFRKEGERIKAQYHDGVMKDRLEYAIDKDEAILLIKNWKEAKDLPKDEVYITDRDITKEELNAIYEDFKQIDRQNGIPECPQVRYQYIAEQNGKVIGFVSGLTNHKWFYLSDMWVDVSHRRQGLGTKLLCMLEEKIKAIGIEHIYTWTSGKNNEAFYEKHGYCKFTTFEGFFEVERFDHVGYRKDFAPVTNRFYSAPFWFALDKLVTESKIIIDRPKGSRHPKYPDFIYPLDYGYLENTSSMDGGGIDVWKGSDGDYIDAIICTVDLMKKDSEVKILIGCKEEEKQLVLDTHNNSEYMKGLLIRRDTK